MEVEYKRSFEEQRIKYSFEFTCESCRYFNPVLQECAHGYPNRMHRLSFYTGQAPPKSIFFCKEFELS